MKHTISPEVLYSEATRLLADNGYVKLPTALSLGKIQLEVPDLWESQPANLDLSLVAHQPKTREASLSLYWLVQRLTRALDAMASRRTVTVILIGKPVSGASTKELLELARVLTVDGSLATERMIGPLLKLSLPATATFQRDGIDRVTDSFSEKKTSESLLKLVKAADAGALAVSDQYRTWLDSSFTNRSSTDG